MPKLGIIVPDDGPMDYELYRLPDWLTQAALPIDVAIADAKTPDGKVNDEPTVNRAYPESAASDEVLHPCARALQEAGCRAIVWACTSGSFVGGYHWARRQAKRIRAVSGLPTTSTTLALVEATYAFDTQTVDIISTYPAFSTDRFSAALAEAGIRVSEEMSLACNGDDGIAVRANALGQSALANAIGRLADSDHPVLIPNTSVNTLSMIEDLERVTGRTLITANQASLWHGARLLECAPRADNAGQLFRLSEGAQDNMTLH